jgi:hypothetical protein
LVFNYGWDNRLLLHRRPPAPSSQGGFLGQFASAFGRPAIVLPLYHSAPQFCRLRQKLPAAHDPAPGTTAG